MKKKCSKPRTKVMYSLDVLSVECKLICTEGKNKCMYNSYFRYPKDISGEVKVIVYENCTFRSALSRFTLEIRRMYEEHIRDCCTPLPF